MYAFISKSVAGFHLEIRTSFDLSCGETVFASTYACKSEAKRQAVQRGAKAWNY